MRAVDIIRKKRFGGELSESEIGFLIAGLVDGTIPDYQISAWAMAVCYMGMTDKETAALTLAMANSGDTVDLSLISGVKVDKHSTGGVGDKTTLIVAPLVAACGVPVAKMSGRGLGHTGGTIDKLESIPGFRTELGREDFFAQVDDIGVAVIGQSGNIAPADKKLYALRDVTATVESIPLIASSVMSKKIAAGADAILLDVKTGDGAFMKTPEEAVKLASAMVAIGNQVGRRTVAVISDMDQPLGRTIGNALEVREAIEVLRGEGPDDLREVSLVLASHMLVLGGVADDSEFARTRLEAAISSGEALRKFAAFVAAQGGDPAVADDLSRFPQAPLRLPVSAVKEGFVLAIEAEAVGLAAMTLGAGRATKDDTIDYAVGIELAAKPGEFVREGDLLATLYVRADDERTASAVEAVRGAYRLGAERGPDRPLLHGIVQQ